MFKPANRTQARFKLGLTGPSGSGKTYSALLIALGLAGKNGRIAVLDTENKSASLYAGTKDLPSFDVVELGPPYDPQRYIEVFKAAVKEKYDILIIDSTTPEWNGVGGILNQKEQLDARGGDSFRNWAKMTPKHDAFVAEILHSDIHMICCIRSKQEYAMTKNDNGKNSVQKLGMAPIQREGLEYELSTVFDLAMNHEASVSKDRTGLFDGKIFRPTVETGELIRSWLFNAPVETPSKPAPEVSESHFIALKGLASGRGWPMEKVTELMNLRYGVNRFTALTKKQYDEVMQTVGSRAAKEVLDEIKFDLSTRSFAGLEPGSSG